MLVFVLVDFGMDACFCYGRACLVLIQVLCYILVEACVCVPVD